MQSVLSPLVGRLSDILDRKYLAAVPPLIAFVGAVISAKATDMNMLIGGGILIGTTLSTISIIQAIPSEILPLKYRPLAQGLAGMGGTVGGLYVPTLLSFARLLVWHSKGVYSTILTSGQSTPTQNRSARSRRRDQRGCVRVEMDLLDPGHFPRLDVAGTVPVLLAAEKHFIS
jgi:MFS family permease